MLEFVHWLLRQTPTVHTGYYTTSGRMGVRHITAFEET
jgi:hypothetical protein